uniref:Proline-rich protein n=1 Tax=Brassica campestris TaxID=3711 RepID=A0A3P5ZK02_BRACM|nr:unnamed protein product [Brassica rapa]
MKLVVLMSFLLLQVLLIVCSSGFEEDGVIHTDQYPSLHKVQETIPRMTDYEEPGPNPGHDPMKPGYGSPPPPPPPKIN